MKASIINKCLGDVLNFTLIIRDFRRFTLILLDLKSENILLFYEVSLSFYCKISLNELLLIQYKSKTMCFVLIGPFVPIEAQVKNENHCPIMLFLAKQTN